MVDPGLECNGEVRTILTCTDPLTVYAYSRNRGDYRRHLRKILNDIQNRVTILRWLDCRVTAVSSYSKLHVSGTASTGYLRGRPNILSPCRTAEQHKRETTHSNGKAHKLS